MNLDHLIPQQIIEYAALDRFDIAITLESSAAQGRWPVVEFWLNDRCLCQEVVQQKLDWKYCTKVTGEIADFRISYTNKTDHDTVVDSQGNILENQCLQIKSIVLNDVDLLQSDLIYQLGYYYMQLSDAKFKYFQEHNYSVDPTHSLDMYENGYWQIATKVPVSQDLAQHKSFWEKHEKFIKDNLVESVYELVLDVKSLQKQIKELKNAN